MLILTLIKLRLSRLLITSNIVKVLSLSNLNEKARFCTAFFADNKMVEALLACEPDMLQVSNISHTVETDQKVLGQLSDLYDRELVGIIGNVIFIRLIYYVYI